MQSRELLQADTPLTPLPALYIFVSVTRQSKVRRDLPPIAATQKKVLKSNAPGGGSATSPPGAFVFGEVLSPIANPMIAIRATQVCMCCEYWRPRFPRRLVFTCANVTP